MEELRDPTLLRAGYISKKVNGIRYVVKVKKDGKHYWAKAAKADIACSRYLSKKVRKMLKEYKKKTGSKIQSREQAIAVAYSMTANKYPKCGVVNRTPMAMGTISKKRSASLKAKRTAVVKKAKVAKKVKSTKTATKKSASTTKKVKKTKKATKTK